MITRHLISCAAFFSVVALSGCRSECLSSIYVPMEVVATDRLTGQRIDSLVTLRALRLEVQRSDTLVFALRDVNVRGGVQLAQGRYQLLASAAGYQTASQEITVGNRGCGGRFESFTVPLTPSPR